MSRAPDREAILAGIRGMSREELLDEVALRADDWTPPAYQVLQDAARERGITEGEIAARRDPAERAEETPTIDFPALLVSCEERGTARELARALRTAGVPALVRETDRRTCGGERRAVGRWGLLVPGDRAAEAARLLDGLAPELREERPAGSCGGCHGGAGEPEEEGEDAPPEFGEEGDWWQAGPGVPLEGDERDR